MSYEDGYCMLDDSYVALPVRVKWENNKATIKKYRDGERRRRRLYIDALLIRKIKMEITFVELLYNMVLRRKWYYDNSDGILTNRILVEIVDSVLKLAAEEFEKIKNIKHARFKTDRIWCLENNITRRSYSRQVVKKLNFEKIGSWYDTSKSMVENYKWAQSNQIKVSKSTLRRFCDENQISTSPGKHAIKEWYDENLSVKANLDYAEKMGIKVSRKTLYRYCEKYGIPTAGKMNDK